MTTQLIVNADDFGLSPGTNRGILEAHQRGILTSTTAMMNMPDAAAGIDQLQRDTPGLGLGLHVTLSQGKPLLPAEQVPSLVTDDGQFVTKHMSLFERIERFQPAELAAELTAQFERFVAVAGHTPSHLDSHHHLVFTIPAAFDTALKLAHQHRIPLRNGEAFLNDDHWRKRAAVIDPDDALPADSPAHALQAAFTANPKPRWPDHLVLSFYNETVTRDNLTQILTTLPAGTTELMCHPGYFEDIEPGYYAEPRKAELDLLTDPAIVELVAEQGIELITFAGLPI